MKTIGLEEHFITPELAQVTSGLPPEQVGSFFKSFKAGPTQDRLLDLGDERLRQMDLIGLDMMVLSVSAPGVELLAPAQAVPLARQANDRVAAAVRAVYYDGFGPELSGAFSGGGWGWHLDAGIGALRLILSGVFDELPNLQIVLGHWGEMVTFYLERADNLTPYMAQKGLKKPLADYFRQHFYVTGSGINTTAYLQRTVEVMGADRVMVSTDYPYQYAPDNAARHFLEQSPLSFDEKEKIAHLNAERLLKL